MEVQFAQQTFLKDTKEMAVNSAHGVAFHRGLGVPLKPSSSIALTEYLSLDAISSYAERAYSVNNCALVANGVEHEEMVKWVDRLFTEDEEVRSEHPAKLESPATEYFGGEERISHGSGNTMVIAFPGSPAPTGASYKPEVAVLTSLLGGQSGIKWSPGFSILSNALAKYQGLQIETKSAVYSDAGLLYIVLHGAASAVKSAASEVVQQFKKISKGEINKEDFQKAVARAKFKELESGETIQGALELTGAGLLASGKPYQFSHSADLISRVTEDQVVKVSSSRQDMARGLSLLSQAASTMLKGKASVSAVGNLFVLPYAGEIGLNV